MKTEEIILFMPFVIATFGIIYLLFFTDVFDTSYDRKKKYQNKLRKEAEKRRRQLIKNGNNNNK